MSDSAQIIWLGDSALISYDKIHVNSKNITQIIRKHKMISDIYVENYFFILGSDWFAAVIDIAKA